LERTGRAYLTFREDREAHWTLTGEDSEAHLTFGEAQLTLTVENRGTLDISNNVANYNIQNLHSTYGFN
jgi:hypothetical protein